MSLEICTQRIRQKLEVLTGLNATLKFDCNHEGVIFIDAQSEPNQVNNENKEANCIVHVSINNLMALLDGELNPVSGFMMGKLKVTGDMSVVMRLQKLLSN